MSEKLSNLFKTIYISAERTNLFWQIRRAADQNHQWRLEMKSLWYLDHREILLGRKLDLNLSKIRQERPNRK
jgi:hypothetical protein